MSIQRSDVFGPPEHKIKEASKPSGVKSIVSSVGAILQTALICIVIMMIFSQVAVEHPIVTINIFMQFCPRVKGILAFF